MTEEPSWPWANWESLDIDVGDLLLSRLRDDYGHYFAGASATNVATTSLSFYENHRLVLVEFVGRHDSERVFLLQGTDALHWLNGESSSIHDANASADLHLSDANAADYLKFFLTFLRMDGAAFVLVESSDDIREGETPQSEGAEGGLTLEGARQSVQPFATQSGDDPGSWVATATIAYRRELFTAEFLISETGLVEMVDDEPCGGLGQLVVPASEVLWRPDEIANSDPESSSPGPGVDPTSTPLHDRQITESVVEVLLEDAINELNSSSASNSTLLRHFNAETKSRKPIEQFSRLMFDSKPVVLIESDVPFVEDFVAGLLDSGDRYSNLTIRAGSMTSDDLRCELVMNDSCTEYLLSFHTYRSLFDEERISHELTLSEARVLIGCNRVSDVPEALRRVADLVITFPQIDRRRFARIFERVFRVKPPPDWDEPGADWTRFLLPADFHIPRRLGMGAKDALSLLRDRVQSRLDLVTPNLGLGLDQLHGMGEARQVAEDLIEDIRAAQVGEIAWSAVDRGMLLIGDPGTGKTTLARAIAKDCGVKFVVASAAKWQSAGALDAHLRAMRADFNEARRYAPAILFIDEIDSIGSRDNLGGMNSYYQTEVINALLEEIQGISNTESVIVIGATNYVDRVDPALRRAGRLDQVVEIPRPNIDGLSQIFDHYLKDYFPGVVGETGVNTRVLAELTFGLTGADVEYFVRGAARRARREGRAMSQLDLVAEITRRPRHPESAPRLSADEIRRVAVHEAGHAVARLLSSTKGADLAFATIIPRLDGSLGYVASVPSDSNVMTRQTMLEYLGVCLAGRAAEELVFGADNVGAGAGGSSSSSDLAVATRFATQIVCQSGLGDDNSLVWTTTPTPDQQQRVGELLRSSYQSIRLTLASNRSILDRIADVLVDKQELSGDALRELARESTKRPDFP
jgi:ATP-dependent Zn protease